MDLNLLKVFDAVYEDRNLVLAGRRLNLTQSAVSHALTRGGELLIRQPPCRAATSSRGRSGTSAASTTSLMSGCGTWWRPRRAMPR